MSRRILLAFGLVIILSACASTPEQVDPNAPEACVTIDNREGLGTAAKVYLVSGSQERIRLGEVPMGSRMRHCVQRSNFGGRWYLVIGDEEMEVRVRRSEDFSLHPGDEVMWEVRMNRIHKEGSGA